MPEPIAQKSRELAYRFCAEKALFSTNLRYVRDEARKNSGLKKRHHSNPEALTESYSIDG
jgi:hypothetical protein